MRKVSKANNTKFVNALSTFIETELKGIKVKDKTDSMKSYTIETIAGTLEVNIWKDASYCYTISNRFVDFERAKAAIKFNCNMNPKYNFLSCGEDVDNVIDQAKCFFKDTQIEIN